MRLWKSKCIRNRFRSKLTWDILRRLQIPGRTGGGCSFPIYLYHHFLFLLDKNQWWNTLASYELICKTLKLISFRVHTCSIDLGRFLPDSASWLTLTAHFLLHIKHWKIFLSRGDREASAYHVLTCSQTTVVRTELRWFFFW